MSALRHPSPPPEAPTPVAALPAVSREALDTIRAAYTFTSEQDALQVFDYLQQRSMVASALVEAIPQLRRFFGDATTVFLIPVERDWGDREIYPRFTALIQARGTESPSDARQHMQRFTESWWNEASRTVIDDLSFNLTV